MVAILGIPLTSALVRRYKDYILVRFRSIFDPQGELNKKLDLTGFDVRFFIKACPNIK